MKIPPPGPSHKVYRTPNPPGPWVFYPLFLGMCLVMVGLFVVVCGRWK